MTAGAVPEQDAAALGRGERLSRDVLHALMIDSKPWAEIQANRREVVRSTFQELDAQDEFEGMLAAQMAIAHSIFLGTSWLSLDRERPERDRTFYLRQATRLMTLYRQHFSTLRQCRKDRGHSAPDQVKSGAECPPAAAQATDSEPSEKERGHSTLPRKAECPRCAVRESLDEKLRPPAPTVPSSEFPPLDFLITQNRRHRLMETSGLAFAQGP